MDPNANLTEQLDLARSILSDLDNDNTVTAREWRLAELIESLDEWLVEGSCLPNRWMKAPADEDMEDVCLGCLSDPCVCPQ